MDRKTVWTGKYADVDLHGSIYKACTKDKATLLNTHFLDEAIERAQRHDQDIEKVLKDKPVYDKWEEVLAYATEHATGKGMHTGYRWLQDSFNEYLDMSDEVPGFSMGGQPGSQFNREVLAGKILLELGDHFGSRHLLDEYQEAKLKKTLDEIVNEQSNHRGLSR